MAIEATRSCCNWHRHVWWYSKHQIDIKHRHNNGCDVGATMGVLDVSARMWVCLCACLPVCVLCLYHDSLSICNTIHTRYGCTSSYNGHYTEEHGMYNNTYDELHHMICMIDHEHILLILVLVSVHVNTVLLMCLFVYLVLVLVMCYLVFVHVSDYLDYYDWYLVNVEHHQEHYKHEIETDTTTQTYKHINTKHTQQARVNTAIEQTQREDNTWHARNKPLIQHIMFVSRYYERVVICASVCFVCFVLCVVCVLCVLFVLLVLPVLLLLVLVLILTSLFRCELTQMTYTSNERRLPHHIILRWYQHQQSISKSNAKSSLNLFVSNHVDICSDCGSQRLFPCMFDLSNFLHDTHTTSSLSTPDSSYNYM